MLRLRAVTTARPRARRAKQTSSAIGGAELLLDPPLVVEVLVGGGVDPDVVPVKGDAEGDAEGDADPDAEGDAEGDADPDAEGDAVGVGAGAAVEQVAVVMVSLIKVTSPVLASARPFSVTPLAIVMDVEAMIVPANVEPDPRVAELVICQKTLQGWPPLMNTTEPATMRSDVPWNTQTEFGSPPPSSVSVPVRSNPALPEL